VVVDKPFTTSVVEADELAAIAARQRRILTVFHNRRWDGDFLTIRSLVADRALGDIVEYESRAERYRPIVRDRWRERPGPGSGIWFDLGAHLVDQALQLFGQPDAIRADLAAQRGHGAIMLSGSNCRQYQNRDHHKQRLGFHNSTFPVSTV